MKITIFFMALLLLSICLVGCDRNDSDHSGQTTSFEFQIVLRQGLVAEEPSINAGAISVISLHQIPVHIGMEHEEARGFFNMVLLNDTGKNYSPDVQFHAAVGLANLGDPNGIEWLISNLDKTSYVANAWPPRVPHLKVGPCCELALRYLSGERELSTKKEWQAWWDSVDRQTMPKYHVMLVDSY